MSDIQCEKSSVAINLVVSLAIHQGIIRAEPAAIIQDGPYTNPGKRAICSIDIVLLIPNPVDVDLHF
jgi:hypothetical protein